ncbi:S8 family peptidase [Actinosynnema pretiosum subsp. pretiosum]|uniref:Peptidase S8 and S53 subtilisin kexin sedolisin n=2 Tax=Actinosynnema TaxID=40566 RepID=C6WAX3_ACTMD|nr:S8 family peptidase [Actinosynnema mirum]ACU37442.1 peptidase S8 and S53 subtilisin kexin sedolisin [Actinosynnema mirum DSM 43827]AXX30915.1 peptidase S8 and S53, subtilisin, kexin, sedolisin [Actinosynnema pretiosum subsp. pretiosum]QUF04984.1 S8 family peptidase [Actinosynnema pretiosum subsp. pretiosum]
MRPARTSLAVLAATATAVVVAATATTGAATAAPRLAALVSPKTGGAVQPVKDSYVVLLKDGAAEARTLSAAEGITPKHVWNEAVKGFSATLSPDQLAEVRRNPAVALVEQDVMVTDLLDATQANPPSYGIDRIDQVSLPLSNSYTYNSTGAGVHAYVIDTGITTTHADFGGRATFDYNAIDTNNTDCYGHGTHVAGTVGSATYGVAKGVRLHAVKMMNCSGGATTTAAVNAINWVTANAQRPAVANTSWNFTASAALETAIRSMISSGVFLATSAGNTAANSCDRLPRKVETATVVASSDSADARSTFSSTGACVDLYAPGTSIRSTLNTGGNGLMSGTSMATPHVAGVAALYKATYGDAPSATVHDWLNSKATPNKITGGATGGTANRLLNTAGL